MTDEHATDEAVDEAVTDEMGYASALVELEAILEELEGEDVDVDVLAERVGRAAELIELCRLRIRSAQMKVEQIVAELEPDAES